MSEDHCMAASPTKPAPSNLMVSENEQQQLIPSEPPQITIAALPADILSQVFRRLSQLERARTALVCARWSQVGRSSSTLWSSIRFEVQLSTPSSVERSESFVHWMVPRSRNVHAITVMCRRMAPEILDPRAESVVLQNVVAALALAGPNLHELSIDCDGHFVVSGWAAALTSLRIANFMAEALTLRPGLGSLSSLQDLRLRSASATLSFIGSSSLLPPGLKALRMDGCHLRQLPHALYSLSQLTDLVLSNNALSQADLDPLTRMTTLQQLTLMGTRMARLPTALSALTNLRVLYLDGVASTATAGEPGITAQIRDVLGPLRLLGILSLGSSRLESFPVDLADNLTALRVLYLDNNPELAELPNGPYLRKLHVLGIDWRLLFRSHAKLMGATALHKLCLTSMGGPYDVPLVQSEGAAVALTLLGLPSLCQVLVPMVDGSRLNAMYITVMNILMALSADGIDVQAVTYEGISNEWIEFLRELEKHGGETCKVRQRCEV